jgi:hypothetical protein
LTKKETGSNIKESQYATLYTFDYFALIGGSK